VACRLPIEVARVTATFPWTSGVAGGLLALPVLLWGSSGSSHDTLPVELLWLWLGDEAPGSAAVELVTPPQAASIGSRTAAATGTAQRLSTGLNTGFTTASRIGETR
jgi:hypothetical protein